MTTPALERAKRRLAQVDHWHSQQLRTVPDRRQRRADWAASVRRVAVLLAAVAEWLIDASSTLAGALVESVDSTVGWLASLVLAPVELLFSVPYAGRALGWLWRVGLTLAWAGIRLPLGLLALVGVLPRMRLRLLVLTAPGVDQQRQLDAIQFADQVLKAEANVQLVPVGPFQLDFPLAAASPDTSGWLSISLSGERLPRVGCALDAFGEDLGPWGGHAERLALRAHPRGAFRRVTGWGAPLSVITVGQVDDGRLAGCSLGPLLDYVTLAADHPVCLLHEVCHALNLPHSDLPRNVMNPTCGGVHLIRWQVALIRLSRHLTCW
ncbi:MAG TPA: hypothetical protein VGA52_09660 [Anaerolineales bacterium]